MRREYGNGSAGRDPRYDTEQRISAVLAAYERGDSVPADTLAGALKDALDLIGHKAGISAAALDDDGRRYDLYSD
jgi:hypothetical protein